MLFIVTIFRHTGDGPLWRILIEAEISDCDKYWWVQTFFLSAIYPLGDQISCLNYLWFASDVMIFFMLLPPQVLLYFRSRKASYILSSLFIIASMATTGILVFAYDININILSDMQNGDKVQSRPWCKIGVYQIGFVFGVFFFEYKLYQQSKFF